jgi:hypothetical protein
VGVGLQDPDRAPPELVAAPAEDDRVEPEGEDAREQELASGAVHQPADELMNIHVVAGSLWAPGHELAPGLLRVFLGGGAARFQSWPAKWQAARWPALFSSRGGSSSEQIGNRAIGQRV